MNQTRTPDEAAPLPATQSIRVLEDHGKKGSSRIAVAIAAATIGNMLEWFDLISYATFAGSIGRTFFPSADPRLSVLLTLATFGLAFVARPLGGALLGAYADRSGRKSALLIGIVLMMVGTAIISFTPAYASIGIAAPCLIVVARILQGFSAGGEFSSATSFLVEQRPTHRAFNASWQFASQGLAILLASSFGVVLSTALSSAQLESWGWRVPFVCGLLIGPVGLYIRRHVSEPGSCAANGVVEQPNVGTPRLATSALDPKSIAVAIGTTVLATVDVYMLLYLPSFAQLQLRLGPSAGFKALIASGLALAVITPFAGWAADRVSPWRVARWAATVTLVAVVPAFLWLVSGPSTARLVAVEAILAVMMAAYVGCLGAILAEIFPSNRRSLGMAVSYNFCTMIFGGFAPFLMALLISSTGWTAAPAVYIALAATIGLVSLKARPITDRYPHSAKAITPRQKTWSGAKGPRMKPKPKELV